MSRYTHTHTHTFYTSHVQRIEHQNKRTRIQMPHPTTSHQIAGPCFVDCGATLKWQIYPGSQKWGITQASVTYKVGGTGSGAVLLSKIGKENG